MGTEAEENQLAQLERLEANTPDEQPEPDADYRHDPEAEQRAQEAEEAAQQGAAMAVGFAEALIKMRFPGVEIDQATKEQITAKAVPVVYKHGGELPDWAKPYQEEIELGLVLVVAGLGIHGQIKQQQADAANDGDQRESSAGEPEHVVLG